MTATHQHLPRYTLQFKNGQLLRHQGPLELAQYRCDGRLASVWQEPCPASPPMRR
jgi:hypothetical protein